MGVDTRILLPEDVRVGNVAQVIGILAGLPKTWVTSNNGSCKWIKVDGVKVESLENMPATCRIILNIPDHWGRLVDKEQVHHTLFHFEPDMKKGGRLMIPPSTPFWIAVGIGLCKFFGGQIDFNDCDSKGWDRQFRKPRPTNSPNVGRPWDNFQQAMFDLKPVTTADMKFANKKASYKNE